MDVLIHNHLHVSHLFLSLGHCRADDPVKESVHGSRVVSHLVVQLIGCEIVEAKESGLLGAEFQDLKAESLVVIFIAIVSS